MSVLAIPEGFPDLHPCPLCAGRADLGHVPREYVYSDNDGHTKHAIAWSRMPAGHFILCSECGAAGPVVEDDRDECETLRRKLESEGVVLSDGYLNRRDYGASEIQARAKIRAADAWNSRPVPAAPVADAGDGELVFRFPTINQVLKEMLDVATSQEEGAGGDFEDWNIDHRSQIDLWQAGIAVALEAERARADAAEQRAADAFARAEKAAQEIATALNQSDEKDRRIAQLDAANKIMLAALELAMQHGTIFDSEERMNIVGRAIAAGKGLTEVTP